MNEEILKIIEKVKENFGDEIFQKRNQKQLIGAVRDFTEDEDDANFFLKKINSDKYVNDKSILLKMLDGKNLPTQEKKNLKRKNFLDIIFNFLIDKKDENKEENKIAPEITEEDKLTYESIPKIEEYDDNNASEKICLTCGKIFSSETAFCKEDGTQLVSKNALRCPKCGKEISFDSKFCQSCGYDTTVWRFAMSGNAEYQNYLGVQYGDGEKLPKNMNKAFYWLKKSAAQGNVHAENNLGTYYSYTDKHQSFYWCKKAAEDGFTDAQYWLAVYYSQGSGVKKNAEKAVYWYKKAAQQGHADAAYSLALNYGIGKGCEKNIKLMDYWLEIAADNGSADAIEMIEMRKGAGTWR